MSVAAAAFLEPVSPELALVDAALATRLRAVLDAPVRHVAAIPSAGPDRDEAAVGPVEGPALASMDWLDENDPIADLIVQVPESRPPDEVLVVAHDHDLNADLPVHETDQQADTSGYPALPAPANAGLEQMDATETALREIRARLATPTPERGRRRRFRKRFTVVSGLSAAVALGVFVTNVGFAHLYT